MKNCSHDLTIFDHVDFLIGLTRALLAILAVLIGGGRPMLQGRTQKYGCFAGEHRGAAKGDEAEGTLIAVLPAGSRKEEVRLSWGTKIHPYPNAYVLALLSQNTQSL